MFQDKEDIECILTLITMDRKWGQIIIYQPAVISTGFEAKKKGDDNVVVKVDILKDE